MSLHKVGEYTKTGCVDCNQLVLLPKDGPYQGMAAFGWGHESLTIYHDVTSAHFAVVVRGKPDHIFMTCQPFEALKSPEGVAAILNFVENIKPEQEVSTVGTDS